MKNKINFTDDEILKIKQLQKKIKRIKKIQNIFNHGRNHQKNS